MKIVITIRVAILLCYDTERELFEELDNFINDIKPTLVTIILAAFNGQDTVQSDALNEAFMVVLDNYFKSNNVNVVREV